MHCDQARTAILERQLGLLTASDAAALDAHVAGCAACAAEARLEGRISESLALLREDYPYPMDVRSQVMAQVETIGEPGRGEVPDRQLAWGSIAASVAALGLLVAGVKFLPSLGQAFQTIASLLGSAFTVVLSVARPVIEILAIPFKLLAMMMDSFVAAGAVSGALEPVAQLTVILCSMLLATGITLVVTRELRRVPATPGREEHR